MARPETMGSSRVFIANVRDGGFVDRQFVCFQLALVPSRRRRRSATLHEFASSFSPDVRPVVTRFRSRIC